MTGTIIGHVAAALWSLLLWAGPAAVALALMIPTWHIVGWFIRERDTVATLWVATILPRLRLVPPPGTPEDLPDELASTGNGGRVVRERMATVHRFDEHRERHRRAA